MTDENSRRGFTLVELMVVISVIAIISAIAIPNLIEVRKRGNETAAIGAMRTLVSAQSIFRENDKDGNGTLDYASDLTMLYNNGQLVDQYLGVNDPTRLLPVRQGYTFQLGTNWDGDPFTSGWGCMAQPLDSNQTGELLLWVDETGVIRFTNANDPSASGVPANTWTPIGQ